MTIFQPAVRRIGEWLLGWTDSLPADAAFLIVCLLSVASMLVTKSLFSDASIARGVHADLRRLRQLLRQARRQGDRPAVRRHRRNRVRVLLVRIQNEFKAIGVSLLLVSVLVVWSQRHLQHRSIAPGQPFRVVLQLPASFDAQLVHLVPQEGVKAEDGYVRQLRASPDARRESLPIRTAKPLPEAIAEWQLAAEAGDHELLFRTPQSSCRHRVVVGTRPTADSIRTEQPGVVIETKFLPYQPWKVVPGVPVLDCPPWLSGYLLIVIPLYLLGSRVLLQVAK